MIVIPHRLTSDRRSRFYKNASYALTLLLILLPRLASQTANTVRPF